MAPITLGYWKIRGLAQGLRLLLKYNEADFENVMYEIGDGPEYSRKEWLDVKFTMGFELPNLPYLIDGDFKITETLAIYKYLARKFNLTGSTEQARVRSDMTYSLQLSIRMTIVSAFYNPNFENMKKGLLEAMPDKVKQLAGWLGENKFFAGEEITYADFPAWDLLDVCQTFSPGCLDEHSNLKEYMKRFEALPTIKAYMESSEYLKFPFTNKYAGWGN